MEFERFLPEGESLVWRKTGHGCFGWPMEHCGWDTMCSISTVAVTQSTSLVAKDKEIMILQSVEVNILPPLRLRCCFWRLWGGKSVPYFFQISEGHLHSLAHEYPSSSKPVWNLWPAFWPTARKSSLLLFKKEFFTYLFLTVRRSSLLQGFSLAVAAGLPL